MDAVDGGGALGALVFPEEQPAMQTNPAATTTANKCVRDASRVVARPVLMGNIIIGTLPDNKHRGQHGWGLCVETARGCRLGSVSSSFAVCAVELLTKPASIAGTTRGLSAPGANGQAIGGLV